MLLTLQLTLDALTRFSQVRVMTSPMSAYMTSFEVGVRDVFRIRGSEITKVGMCHHDTILKCDLLIQPFY